MATSAHIPTNMLLQLDIARSNYHAAMVREYGKDVADEVIRLSRPMERPIDPQAVAP